MNEDSKCEYPDWEGNLETNKHDYDKDGFCIICGEKREDKS